MCEAQPFSFGEYNRDLTAQQKDVIRSLVQASLGSAIEEIRYWHIEEELALWAQSEEGFCLPKGFVEFADWKDRLAWKWSVVIHAAAAMAENRSTWQTIADTRNPAEVIVLLIEESNPDTIILWKQINAYKGQFPDLKSLATGILVVAAEIKRNAESPIKHLAAKLQYEHTVEVHRRSRASLQKALENFKRTEQGYHKRSVNTNPLLGPWTISAGTRYRRRFRRL